MLFFLRLCPVAGVLGWHSLVLALLISSTTCERFHWIAQHLGRLHREHPDCTAHQNVPALLLPRSILLLSRNFDPHLDLDGTCHPACSEHGPHLDSPLIRTNPMLVGLINTKTISILLTQHALRPCFSFLNPWTKLLDLLLI